MSNQSLRRWSWIHKWSSLVCTVFMLLLCLTGLPLIYHHEIGHLLGNDVEAPNLELTLAPELAANPPRANLDDVIAAGKALYPGKIMMYMSQEIDEPAIWNVTLGDPPNDEHYKPIAVDARTAKVITEPAFEGGAFMSTMLRLHVDLFAGLPGMLFLGCMGLLLIVAIVSGVVLYAPFMRKLEFGTVREGRTKRLKWLDLHNLLGIVTLVWALVVGATGVVNTLADVLLKVWQAPEIAAMPMAFHTLIGDIGTGLSGGQKQRILLARALYKNPKILVLDEATSHLDVWNEQAVNQAIQKIPLTRIIVAHRPETIQMAERVIVLHNGQVAQDVNKPNPEGQQAA